MNFIGNLLWIIFGGLFTALVWYFFGFLAWISIIGIPWGRACFVMAGFVLRPFGRTSISRDLLTGRKEIGTGLPGTIGNLIWFLFAGIWIALGHIGTAVGLAVSIVGIPFAWQHIKLAELALFPIGKTIVPTEVAEAVRLREAEKTLNRMNAS